jgi:hypothetical protein
MGPRCLRLLTFFRQNLHDVSEDDFFVYMIHGIHASFVGVTSKITECGRNGSLGFTFADFMIVIRGFFFSNMRRVDVSLFSKVLFNN